MRLFLDYDILRNQGERISLADVEDPNGDATTQNPDCVSCHQVLDPVSGLFQDFSFDGYSLEPPPDGDRWPENLHPAGTAGIGGEDLAYDSDVHGPSIQFLGHQIASDPRFAKTMVEYAWTQVMGHSPLEGIEGFEGDDFQARQALILAQQSFMQNLTERFVRENYNMRLLYVRLFTSTWYRIKSLSPPVDDRISDAVFEGVGRHGILTPEEYFRRIEAVYGEPWPLRGGSFRSANRLTPESVLTWDFFTRTDSEESGNAEFDLLYGLIDVNFRSFFGGIDFQNNLNRSEQMNAIMSLVARRVANEFSCLAVYHDLRKPPRQRRFFGALPEGVPDGALPEARARRAIVHLFEHILGQSVEEDGPDVTLALGLFLDIQSLVRAQIEMAADDEEAGEESDDGPEFMPRHCAINGSQRRGDVEDMDYPDPTGEIRGWMAVVTYLLLQPEFVQR